jgi:hypothetical protein
MRLENFVLELLYHHDCVVVPQWGGLVANYRAARLNAVSHVISPPSKHIGFNRNLVIDDGLLAHHVGLVLGIAHADAARIVAQYVGDLRSELQANGRVVWEKIGVFYNDAQGALQFMPQDQENFLLSSYGLHPIQLKALRHEQPIEAPTIAPSEKQAASRFNWKYAAAAVVPFLTVAGLLWTMQQQPEGDLNWASLNPFASHTKQSTYVLSTQPEATWINTPIEQEEILRIGQERSETPVKTAPVKSVPAKGGYAVIGGAFKVKDNAEKFVKQLRETGFDAKIVGRSGAVTLVAYGVYSTRTEASNALANLRSTDGKSAWIKPM